MLTKNEMESLYQQYEDAVQKKETADTALWFVMLLTSIVTCFILSDREILALTVSAILVFAEYSSYAVLKKRDKTFNKKEPLVCQNGEKTWYLIRTWDVYRPSTNGNLVSMDGKPINPDIEYALILNDSRNAFITSRNRIRIPISEEQYGNLYHASLFKNAAICLSEDEYMAAASGHYTERSAEALILS